MSLKQIIPKLELDTKVSIYTLFGQFYGQVGESAYHETSLTLQTSKGVMYFDLDDIKGIRIEPDREF